MEPIEYLRALRRRWLLVVGTLALAVGVAWTTTTVVPVGPPVRNFEATTVILNTGPLNVPGISTLGTVAALTTVGEVPVRVAKRLDFEGNPLALAARVTAFSDTENGLLEITARGTDGPETQRLADAFAEELLTFLVDRKAETIAEQADFVAQRMEQLEAETRELDSQIGSASSREAEFLRQTRDAKVQIFGQLSQQYNSLISAAADPGTLLIVQEASPTEVVQTGFQPPRSRTGRLVLAAIVGLFIGVGLALLLERIDTRIRTKEAAERHFHLPVLSEIPQIRRRGSGGKGIVTSDRPTSAAADGFRLLAASIGRAPSGNGPRRAPFQAPSSRVQSILVTSASSGEGKSMVVANLAAAFSQMLKRVLILSCDLRHPSVHQLLGVENGNGLADVLRKRRDGQPVLESYVKNTVLPGVQLVPSGPPPPQPSSLLTTETMRRALDEARGMADVVLLDTPPILHASDAAHLVEEVDAVLLVARAGSTRVEHAARAIELLKRLDAPMAGVVLNQTSGVTVGRRERAGFGVMDRGFSQLASHLRGR